jgi:tetratricopeptide (TPR) repeat protein
MQASSTAHRPASNTAAEDAGQTDARALLVQARNAAFREASQGHLSLGLALLEGALEFEPMSHDVLSDIAALLLAAGELDQAAAYAKRALQSQLDHGPSLYTLGFALSGLGRVAQARKVLGLLLSDAASLASLSKEAPDLIPLVRSELDRLQGHASRSKTSS